MAAKPKRSGSRADAVSASLRRDILAGRLEPGQRLTFPELCATYSVSVGVLREALVRLVDHGIIRTESNLGFRVLSLSDEDLKGLTAVRNAIEPHYVFAAVTAGSMQWEADLVAAHHLLERTPLILDDHVSEEWIGTHLDFHLALIAGANNRRMVEMTRRLRLEADLYQRWYAGGGEDPEALALEHRQILDAALARDADAARALVSDHITEAADQWLRENRAKNSVSAVTSK